MPTGRALHYVFRIGNRQASYDFYADLLGMTVLRHEEFTNLCKAACNGPYDGAWSKTMIGYGNEDDHFVLELTYNYARVKNHSSVVKVMEDNIEYHVINDPDGHPFYVKEGNASSITKVSLNVKNLCRSTEFWTNICEMRVETVNSNKCILSFGHNQCKLELNLLDESVALQRGTAFGRIAFSCPSSELQPLEARVRETNAKYIFTPYVSLDTPGKATVQVVILQDPNDHEICFVGDEGYRELSRIDSNAPSLLKHEIKMEAETIKRRL